MVETVETTDRLGVQDLDYRPLKRSFIEPDFKNFRFNPSVSPFRKPSSRAGL